MAGSGTRSTSPARWWWRAWRSCSSPGSIWSCSTASAHLGNPSPASMPRRGEGAGFGRSTGTRRTWPWSPRPSTPCGCSARAAAGGRGALAWVSGVFLVFLLYVCGWTGYVMVWDAQGQLLAAEGARLLDALPLFSEPISRTFSGRRPAARRLLLHEPLPAHRAAGRHRDLSLAARVPGRPAGHAASGGRCSGGRSGCWSRRRFFCPSRWRPRRSCCGCPGRWCWTSSTPSGCRRPAPPPRGWYGSRRRWWGRLCWPCRS